MGGPNTTGLTQPNDLVLGRGIVKVAVLTNSLPGPWRDVGNCPAFSVSEENTVLDHVSSRAGLRTVDKSVVTEQKLSIKFGLDEINHENLALFLSGEKASYTNGAIAGFAERTLTTAAEVGRSYDIQSGAGARAYDILAADVTVKSLAPSTTVTAAGGRTLTWASAGKTITASTGSFITDGYRVGQKITVAGSVSNNGTFTITVVTALVLTVVEALTDETIAATATIVPAKTTLVKDTDYTLELTMGSLFLMSTSTLVLAGDTVYLTLAAQAAAKPVHEVRALSQVNPLVALRFTGENPANNNKREEWTIHQIQLKPSGDFGLISDEFVVMSFEGIAEKNEIASPNSPYLTVREHADS